jgi:hypothetical protein
MGEIDLCQRPLAGLPVAHLQVHSLQGKQQTQASAFQLARRFTKRLAEASAHAPGVGLAAGDQSPDPWDFSLCRSKDRRASVSVTASLRRSSRLGPAPSRALTLPLMKGSSVVFADLGRLPQFAELVGHIRIERFRLVEPGLRVESEHRRRRLSFCAREHWPPWRRQRKRGSAFRPALGPDAASLHEPATLP